MLTDGAPQWPWKETELRESRLVFIGRNMPGDMLCTGFEVCRVRSAMRDRIKQSA